MRGRSINQNVYAGKSIDPRVIIIAEIASVEVVDLVSLLEWEKKSCSKISIKKKSRDYKNKHNFVCLLFINSDLP